MADQADGSIIVDTEVNPEGFKAGSAELLAAIKSLSTEVKELGKTLKETFGGNNKSVSETDNKVQALESTISSLQSETESLKTTITELEEKLKNLSGVQSHETPIDGVAESAQAADTQVTELQSKIRDLENVIAQMQSELNGAFSDPADIDFNTNAAEEKIASLESKVEELESHIAALQTRNATATPTANFSGTATGTSSLQRQVDSVSNSVSRLENTFQRAMGGNESAMASFHSKASELEQKIADIKTKLEALGQAKIPTDRYKTLESTVNKLEGKLIQLINRQDKMSAMGVKENTKQWQNLQYEIDETIRKLERANSEMSVLRGGGHAYTLGSDTAQYQQLSSTLAQASAQLSQMQSDASAASRAVSGIGNVAKSAYSWISKMAKAVGNRLVSSIKSAVKGMAKLVTGTKSADKQFGRLISNAKQFTLSLLGARGVYALLRKAVSAYMAENEQLTANLNACWSSLGNILGPIINRVITLVSTAIAYLTKFLNLLGFVGKSTSNAINSAGGAAASQVKKLQRHLASFDELERLGDNNTDDGGSGGASDIQGVMPEVTLPNWVEQIVEQLKAGNWSEAATILADQLNSMVDSVDWEGIGSKIGYYLNGALEFLATAIKKFDWFKLGSNLGKLINNIIYGVDWENLGVVLGWKFIALIEGLGGLFATLDWAALGRALSDAFMGLWNAIDWIQAAKTLSDGIIGVLNGLSTAIENVNWQKLGNDIAVFIANIDYSGVFSALSRGIGAALGGIAGFLRGLIEEAWNSVVEWWHDVAYEDGQFTVEGLLQGIWDAICNIGNWIVEHIFNPFIEGFKAAFGINSPSTVMQEQGRFIVEGLLLGLQEAWTGLKEWITTAFNELLTVVQEWSSNVKESITSWINETKEGITGWVEETKGKVSEWAENIKSKIKNATTESEKSIEQCAESTEEIITEVSEETKAAVDDATSSVEADIEECTESTENTVSEWADTTKTEIASWTSETESDIASWGAEVDGTIDSKTDSVKSTLANGFRVARDSIVNNMQNAMSTLKSQDWYGIGSDICSGIANGLSAGWSWLIDLVCKIVNSLYSAACRALGIHSPSRLFRDGVGKNIGLGVGEGIEASESSVIDSVIGIADAISEEFKANEYSIDGILTNTKVDQALTSFSDKIANSFTALMDRMQAIAESATFSVPKLASGSVVPYNAAATMIKESAPGGTGNESIVAAIADLLGADVASYEAILDKLDAILQAIDEIEIGDTTIGEANQRYVRKMNVIRGVNA